LAGDAVNPKEFVVPGAAETTNWSEKSTKAGMRVYAQLEKSSIWLFKTMPSGVMTVEPQYKFIAM